MSGAKHTPGPWAVRVEEQHYVTSGEGRIANALFPRYAADGSEVLANARLIAAAPELLEALEYAIAQVPELATVPGIADTIAKVTGGTP